MKGIPASHGSLSALKTVFSPSDLHLLLSLAFFCFLLQPSYLAGTDVFSLVFVCILLKISMGKDEQHSSLRSSCHMENQLTVAATDL